jgi:hypothetical protein
MIRVGREIAVESCTGYHMATPRREFYPAFGDAIPSFEEIANRPGATVFPYVRPLTIRIAEKRRVSNEFDFVDDIHFRYRNISSH